MMPKFLKRKCSQTPTTLFLHRAIFTDDGGEHGIQNGLAVDSHVVPQEFPVELEDDMRNKSKQNPSKKWPRKNVVYNTPVQSLASDGLKQSLVLLWPHLKALDARPVNLVHDEIIIECRKDVAAEMLKILEDCMVRGMECYLKKVPVLVEAKIADSWAGK